MIDSYVMLTDLRGRRAARRVARLMANVEKSRIRYDQRQYDGSTAKSEEI
jgi:hypothetical protein